MTVAIHAQLLILGAAVAAAAACEDLHEAHQWRSTIPLRPGFDSTSPSFSASLKPLFYLPNTHIHPQGQRVF